MGTVLLAPHINDEFKAMTTITTILLLFSLRYLCNNENENNGIYSKYNLLGTNKIIAKLHSLFLNIISFGVLNELF